MRGKGLSITTGERPTGITPAYAGKRSCWIRRGTCGWDHPRVCGEKFSFVGILLLPQGSPPRMRGKVPPAHHRAFLSGITPAYAGKRRRLVVAQEGARDHPRVCGEKTQKALKYKRSFFQVLIFHLTSDRSQVSAHSLSVLDGSQSHPVPNKRILPQGNNCSVRQVSVGPASGYL